VVDEIVPGLRGVATGGFGLGPHDQEVDRFVTLKHLFGIVPRDVTMKGNTTSATIQWIGGRKPVRRHAIRRGRWMVVTHSNRRQDFVFR
jgi:hypothetical protein